MYSVLQVELTRLTGIPPRGKLEDSRVRFPARGRRDRFVQDRIRMALRCWDEHVLGVPRPANIVLWAMLFIKVNRCNSLPSPLVPETIIQAYAREVYGTGGAMPDFSTKQFLYSDQALNHSYAKAYVHWMFPNLIT